MDRRQLIKYISLFSLIAILAIQKPIFSKSASRFFLPELVSTYAGYLPFISIAPQPSPTPTPTSTPVPTPLPLPTPLPAGTPPLYSSSIYMLTVDSVRLYNYGCKLGAKDAAMAGIQNTIVILDFGSPKVVNSQYGADLFWMGPVNITQIKSAVENFGRGYYVCAGADRGSQIYVGIGTTNYGSTIGASTSQARSHGIAWAQMVNDVNSWLISYGYSSQVHAVGAIDIEPAWNSAAVSRAWGDGYDSVNLYDYYDFGTADGCATRSDPNRVTCGNGWTREDVWYKAYGTRPAFPLPEIYNSRGANAEQWALISLYSVNYKGYLVEYHGVLTQWQACLQAGLSNCVGVDNLPSTGWLQLYNELKKDVRTFYTPRWSSDMVWGYSNVVADLPATGKGVETGQVQPQLSLPEQTIASMQKALLNPNLDPQMKSSLEEKLTDAKRLQSDTAAGLANSASKAPVLAPAPPAASDAEFQSGIFEGVGGMIHSWEGSMVNHWQDLVSGEYVLVSAGEAADDNAQGLVMVIRVSADRESYRRNFYQTPTRNGEVKVIGANGTDLLLQAADGSQITFDVLTNQFK